MIKSRKKRQRAAIAKAIRWAQMRNVLAELYGRLPLPAPTPEAMHLILDHEKTWTDKTDDLRRAVLSAFIKLCQSRKDNPNAKSR